MKDSSVFRDRFNAADQYGHPDVVARAKATLGYAFHVFITQMWSNNFASMRLQPMRKALARYGHDAKVEIAITMGEQALHQDPMELFEYMFIPPLQDIYKFTDDQAFNDYLFQFDTELVSKCKKCKWVRH